MADNETNSTAEGGESAGTTDISENARQRFAITVPEPVVMLNMGESGTTFGYAGLSLGSNENLFQNIKKQSLLQVGGNQTEITGGYYNVFTKKDYAVSSATWMRLVAKRPVIISSGVGYYQDPEGIHGKEEPYTSKYDDLDLTDFMGPVQSGLRSFDEAFGPGIDALQSRINPGVAAVGAAVVQDSSKLAEAAGKVGAALFGEAEPPTTNSLFLDEFFPEPGGLLGALDKVNKNLRRINKALGRPETLPFVGPVIAKVNQLQATINAGQELKENALGTYNMFRDHNWNSPSSSQQPGNNAQAPGASVSYVKGYLNEARKYTRAVSDVVKGGTEVLEAAGALLGMIAPSPGAVGLFGKQGVSIGTPDRFFAFACDGIHLVSASKGDADFLGSRDIVGAALNAASNSAIGQGIKSYLDPDPPRPMPVPGFFVETTGRLRMHSSSEDVTIGAASSTYGVLKLQGYTGVEIASGHALGLSSRSGPVEIFGASIGIGAPPFSGTVPPAGFIAAATAAPVEGKALLDANVALSDLLMAVAKAKADIFKAQKQLTEVGLKLAVAPLTAKPALLATQTTLATALTTAKTALTTAETAITAAATARDTAQTAATVAGVPEPSEVAKVVDGATKTDKQVYPEKIQLAAADTAATYAGTSARMASKEVVLQGVDAAWAVAPAAGSEVKLNATSVTIQVGPTATVKVEGVTAAPTATITIGADSKVEITATAINITQGVNSVKLSATGITITGKPELTLSAEKFSAQSQMVLLGG